MMTCRLTICVDDVGMAPGIIEAVRDLADLGRIHAASCVTNLPGWADGVDVLLKRHPDFDLGLHSNLTAGKPLSDPKKVQSLTGRCGNFHSNAWLYARSRLGLIRPHEVALELDAQCSAFAKITGFAPRHIDSHHHVHEFPGLRKGVLDFLAKKKFAGYVRNTRVTLRQLAAMPASARVKSFFVSTLSSGFRRALETAGLATNDSFCGAYLRHPSNILLMYEKSLRALAPEGHALFMVHPSASPEGLQNFEGRFAEFEALRSETFSRILNDLGPKVRGPIPPSYADRR